MTACRGARRSLVAARVGDDGAVMTEDEYERAFRRAGLPMLTEDYSPASDIYNRAVPLIGFVMLLEILAPLNADWSAWQNLAAILVSLAVLLAALGAANLLRGRPFLSRPKRVGKTELAAFVIIPALLPGVISGHWGIAALTALGNLVLLGLILGVVGFGLLSIVGWAISRLLGDLARSLGLLVKAVPLLMVFALLLFLTPELWEVFAQLDNLSLALLIGLFVLLGGAFLVARIPKEVGALEREAGGEGPPLKARQRFNVGLVLFVSQSLQVLLVALAVAAFFVVFGLLTVNAELVSGWIHDSANVLFGFRIGDRQAQVTTELLRVAAALASFTGLYFAISMLTDDLYRREFLSEITDEMKVTFRMRAEYLRLRAEQP